MPLFKMTLSKYCIPPKLFLIYILWLIKFKVEKIENYSKCCIITCETMLVELVFIVSCVFGIGHCYAIKHFQ